MNSNQNLKLVSLVFVLLTVVCGCKSTKKASSTTDAAAEKKKMEQEANLRKQKEEEENAKRNAESALNVMIFAEEGSKRILSGFAPTVIRFNSRPEAGSNTMTLLLLPSVT